LSSDWEVTGRQRRWKKNKQKPPGVRRQHESPEVYKCPWYQDWGLDKEPHSKGRATPLIIFCYEIDVSKIPADG
jgi:hypothetical protein